MGVALVISGGQGRNALLEDYVSKGPDMAPEIVSIVNGGPQDLVNAMNIAGYITEFKIGTAASVALTQGRFSGKMLTMTHTE